MPYQQPDSAFLTDLPADLAVLFRLARSVADNPATPTAVRVACLALVSQQAEQAENGRWWSVEAFAARWIDELVHQVGLFPRIPFAYFATAVDAHS
jgi:hypothetical protein